MPAHRPRRRPSDERGSSPLTMVFSVAVFLGFLLLATQVLLHLYTTSTVGAVTFDAARRAAADGGACDGTVEARVRDALGAYGRRLHRISCTRAEEQTVVTVVGPTPARLVDAFGAGLGLGPIERTARVHTEVAPDAPAGRP